MRRRRVITSEGTVPCVQPPTFTSRGKRSSIIQCSYRIISFDVYQVSVDRQVESRGAILCILLYVVERKSETNVKTMTYRSTQVSNRAVCLPGLRIEGT